MRKTGLNSPVINIFIDDIKIITLKKSKIIPYIKIKLILMFLIVEIDFIIFYLRLKVEQN